MVLIRVHEAAITTQFVVFSTNQIQAAGHLVHSVCKSYCRLKCIVLNDEGKTVCFINSLCEYLLLPTNEEARIGRKNTK